MCKSLKLTKLYHSSKIEKEKTEKNRFSFLALLCIKYFECRVSRALNKTLLDSFTGFHVESAIKMIQTWKIHAEKVLEDVSGSHFFTFEKTFSKVSVQNFCHGFTWYQWLTKFLIAFLQIIIQNCNVQCVICTSITLFASLLHFLHWCYTWTALLSVIQNRVIYTCIIRGDK